MITTPRDVTALIEDARLGARVRAWCARGDPAKVAWAWAYSWSAPKIDEVFDALVRSNHALGRVSKSADHPAIRDAHAEWTLSFLWHCCREADDRVPTFGDFWSWLLSEPDLWIVPMVDTAKRAGLDRRAGQDAIRWRAANGWQSSVREAHLLAELADASVRMHYHPIVDVELRADGWIGRDIIAIYVPSPHLSHKLTPESIFGPRYTIHRIPVERQGYGRVWLVGDDQVEKLIRTLRHSVT